MPELLGEFTKQSIKVERVKKMTRDKLLWGEWAAKGTLTALCACCAGLRVQCACSSNSGLLSHEVLGVGSLVAAGTQIRNLGSCVCCQARGAISPHPFCVL